MYASKWITRIPAICLLACGIAHASYAIPSANTVQGAITTLNYAARTITLNGHVYPVASKVPVTGARQFEGLQQGMRVQIIMSGPAGDQSSVIRHIIVLPAHPGVPQANP